MLAGRVARRPQLQHPPSAMHCGAAPWRAAVRTPPRLGLIRCASSSGKEDGTPPARSSSGSGRESPTSSVSDAVVSFFDELTRGSIDEFEDKDSHTTATAGTQAGSAASERGSSSSVKQAAVLSEAVGQFEVAAVAAAVAASGSIDDSTSGASTSGSSSKVGARSTSGSSKPTDTRRPASGDKSSSSQAVAEGGPVDEGQAAAWVLKGVVGVGLLQAFKAGVEAATNQLGIVSIPAAVISMLAVPVLLTALGSATADRLVVLFDRAVAPWTTDLLGLFLVPAVAILPVLLRGMQGADLAGLLGVAAASTAATLLLTAKAAAAWTPGPAAASSTSQPPASGSSFSLTSSPAGPLLLALSFLAATGPLALTRFDPVSFGAAMALPVGFAWSLLGFVAATVYLQQQQQQEQQPWQTKGGGRLSWLSPVLAGAVAANVGVAWHSSITGFGYLAALSAYYASGEALGAGEVLTAPLGAALTALGVLIYKHRAALCLPAIAATSLLSAAFSVATAVAAARVLGVSPDWARALIPRSVFGDSASHFARAISAPCECTGLVVLLQAALAAAFGRGILRRVLLQGGGDQKLQVQQSAAAGTALGATAGFMGIAGVCGSDEVALASGALAHVGMVLVACAASNVPALASLATKLVA